VKDCILKQGGDMTIKQLLKSYPASVMMHDRWLTINEAFHSLYYDVYEQKPYAKKTKVIYSGNSESKAVEALIGNEE
jgi:hypothetical protein